jgi:Ca2+-binding RTX toxin-like protein
MRTLRLAGASLVLLFAVTAIAYAGTASQDPNAITYTVTANQAGGESVNLGIENGKAFVSSDVPVTAGTNCLQTDPNRVDCALAPLFKLTLGGFDDSVVADLVTGSTAVQAHGGGGGDSLSGTPNADSLFGDEGDDRIDGRAGNDTLDGGGGADSISDGPGDDSVVGAGGNDELTDDSGRDTFAGGEGVDRINYSARVNPVTVTLDGQADDGEAGEGDNIGADVEDVIGGAGGDRIVAGPSGATLSGNGGNDSMTGSPAEDRFEGGDGDDTIDSRDGGYDTVECGPGNDTVLADLTDALHDCEITPDRDNDGTANEQDCAPDDPAVHPGASEIFGNALDEDCSGGPAYLRVDAGVVFKATPNKKKQTITWKTLRATALDDGDHVEITCKGKGCPFKKATRDAASGNPQLDLKKLFKKKPLKKGAVVEIRILHEAQIGIVRQLQVVKGPKVKETRRCLLVGATAPSSCPAT